MSKGGKCHKQVSYTQAGQVKGTVLSPNKHIKVGGMLQTEVHCQRRKRRRYPHQCAAEAGLHRQSFDQYLTQSPSSLLKSAYHPVLLLKIVPRHGLWYSCHTYSTDSM